MVRSRQISRELLFGKARMSSLCEHNEDGCSAHLYRQPQMLEIKKWERRKVTRTGRLSARAFFKESKDQSGWPCIIKDLHQAVKSKKIWGKQEGKSAVGFEKKQKDRGVEFYGAGDEKEIKTRAQVRLGLSAVLFAKPDGRIGKSLGLEERESVPSVASEYHSTGNQFERFRGVFGIN